MQFMRSDDHHLDACWMTWNHPDTKLKLTTYPMVHIADREYYDRVAADLSRCRHVLLEGVSWRTGDRRRPLYDLAARNLGLAAQEVALRYPASATRLNVDMGRAEFRSEFFRLPIHRIVLLVLLRRVLWLVTLFPSLRKDVIRYVFLHRRWRSSRDDAPVDRLIIGSRDRRIVENVKRFFREHGQGDETRFAGIVFGAGHMPAISAGLRDLGFQVGTRRWIEVFRIRPATSPAGRLSRPS